MPSITVVTRAGEGRIVSASNGSTLMEIIRDNGFDELLALCGGCCSCATCHVHVDAEFLAAAGEMTEDEDALLDSSDHRNECSRLSCQITMNDALDGMRVTIAPED